MVVLLLIATPGQASAEDTAPAWWVQGRAHGAILSDLVDGSAFQIAFGFAASAGVRWDSVGLFVTLDNPWWAQPVLDEVEVDDAFDVAWQAALAPGLGFEVLSVEGRLRTSLAVGASFLLRRTIVDAPGTAGFWAELRPIGLRFELAPGVTFEVDPLTFTLMIPDPTGIPAVLIQYRTMLGVEARL